MGLFAKKKSRMLLTVPEMSCGHCEAKIQTLLGALPQVKEVKADSKSKIATLTLEQDAEPSLESISEALSGSGYSAQPKA
ncbi:MAG: copper chaperone [Spirochaetaceae bacterium]|nr:MAG: copper chaperone [Spirochaetaceae bacterium]